MSIDPRTSGTRRFGPRALLACALLLGCSGDRAEASAALKPQPPPSLSPLSDIPLGAQAGDLDRASVRFATSAEALVAFSALARVQGVRIEPLPNGTTASGSVRRIRRNAIHYRVHLAGATTAALELWLAATTRDHLGTTPPEVCRGLRGPCDGKDHLVVTRRGDDKGVTLDMVVAHPVTAQLLTTARSEAPPANAALLPPGRFAVDVDNDELRAMLSVARPGARQPPLPLRQLELRGRVESGELRARARWTTDASSTAPWLSRHAQLTAPELGPWCGTSACAGTGALPSPARLREVFPPLDEHDSRTSPSAFAPLEHVAFGWPHALAAIAHTPLLQLQPPVRGFAEATVEALGTVDAAGLRWGPNSAAAFVRAPKPTVDLVAGLLAYVGNVQTVDAGGESVSQATGIPVPGFVFMALDDETPQSDGWIAVSPDAATFAALRKQDRVRYATPWVYAHVPNVGVLAPTFSTGIESLRLLGTIEDEAFVLDLEARLSRP